MTLLAADARRVEASRVTDASGFDPSETHGIYSRPGCTLHSSSAALGWRNLFVSTLTEPPWEATYGSVRHHFLVVQRNGPVRLTSQGRWPQRYQARRRRRLYAVPRRRRFYRPNCRHGRQRARLFASRADRASYR